MTSMTMDLREHEDKLECSLVCKVVDQVEDAVIHSSNKVTKVVTKWILAFYRVIPIDQSTVTMNRMVEKADAT